MKLNTMSAFLGGGGGRKVGVTLTFLNIVLSFTNYLASQISVCLLIKKDIALLDVIVAGSRNV